MKQYYLSLLFLMSVVQPLAAQETAAAVPVHLRCEYAINPLGIDKAQPRLSWHIETPERAWYQAAYEIVVASDSVELLNGSHDLWSSGKITSGQNIGVPYNGVHLKPANNCWWKVRVWDEKGNVSAWSAIAYWKMGLLREGDWKGQWIGSDMKLTGYQRGLKALPDFDMETENSMWQRADSIRKHVRFDEEAPAVYMRREFTHRKTVKRATAYICGLGYHELYLNGQRVSDALLNPAYTDYQKRVLYNTYNVTSLVRQGQNAIGVILGNGWYNPIVPHGLRFYTADYINTPRLLFQLFLEYTDGSSAVITSDRHWKFTTKGPVRYNDILGGETYDARQEMPGWSAAGFQDTGWNQCLPVEKHQGKIVSQQLSPVTRLSYHPATGVEKTESGYRFDLGRELCGWVKIKLKGREGQRVKIQYLGAGSHTLGRYQTHYIILDGKGEKVVEPRFSYNGFRYITVEGIDYTPAVHDVVGVLVATRLEKAGTFSCSNERLNSIQDIFINTINNYIVHLPNDPTREKSGWVQDIQGGFDVNAYNFNVAGMYRKWQYDFNDIVHSNGYVPPVVPSRFDGPTINGPWWGGMIIYNTEKLYEYYQDLDIVCDSYDGMKRYLGYLQSISKDHIVEWGLGDWMEPSSEGGRPTSTPVPLTSTIAFYHFTKKMAVFAGLLHQSSDSLYFEKQALFIKKSYNRRFLNTQTGQYALGSQAAQLMSLHFGLVPDDKRELVLQKLREAIARQNGHLSTGFVATPVLLTTLCDLGLANEAYQMATKEDYPGWIDMIFNKGNTVMKESWDGGLVQMPSLAGPVGYWFFHSLAGIRTLPGTPAFKKFIIKPQPVEGLTWVSTTYQSVRGEIKSAWKKETAGFQLQIKIPANTTALVYLPATATDTILENGKIITNDSNFPVEETTSTGTVIRLGSGSYSFLVKNR